MWSVFIFSSGLIAVISATDCQNFFECCSSSIDDEADCFGFGSCHSVSVEGSSPAYCDGPHACHGALIDTSDEIFCRSVASCRGSSLSSSSELFCEGVASCAQAEVTASSKVYAYGHYGAVASHIVGSSSVRGYGYYSLLFATVDSGEEEKMSVKLYGVDAGYGANIVCQAGAICSLTCKGGACLNTDFVCMNGAECSVSPQECEADNSVEEYGGVTCPTWKASISEQDDEDFLHYMEEKDAVKEQDIKWKLFQTYTKRDTDLFNEIMDQQLSETKHKEQMVQGSGFVKMMIHGKDMYAYVVAVIISVVLIAVICTTKKYDDQYQKLDSNSQSLYTSC